MPKQMPAVKMDSPQQYCLRWKYHHSNLQAMFSQLLERECFCDVTLACEGKTLKAHKVMLSACSTYFDSIFSQHEESNPIVILKDVRFSDIKALVQFMYKGEINVENSELTSLLRTAEELRIKGLAEVSWRSDHEMEGDSGEDDEPSPKRVKSEYLTQKLTSDVNESRQDSHDENVIEEEVEDGSDADDSYWDAERTNTSYDDTVPSGEVPLKVQTSVGNVAAVNTSPTPTLPSTSAVTPGSGDDDKNATVAPNAVPSTYPESINMPDLSQYPDIMKMNDYLESGGRRPQFWEEPFTKRLMEAIKNKELEMKVAAELMGVSYGTLYGRYRDAYGCLKHPYRVRDFWSEQGPAEVLSKLQRKELTLFRAAEMLNVTVTTLANYLSTLKQGATSSDNEEVFENEEMDEEDNISSANQSSIQDSHPNILTVKKENVSNLNGS